MCLAGILQAELLQTGGLQYTLPYFEKPGYCCKTVLRHEEHQTLKENLEKYN